VRPVWLEAGGGVGVEGLVVIEPEPIGGALDCGRDEGREISRGLSFQLDDILMAAVLEDDRDTATTGRPHADMERRIGQEFRPDGQAAVPGRSFVGCKGEGARRSFQRLVRRVVSNGGRLGIFEQGHS
jgi:hypothetical protein